MSQRTVPSQPATAGVGAMLGFGSRQWTKTGPMLRIKVSFLSEKRGMEGSVWRARSRIYTDTYSKFPSKKLYVLCAHTHLNLSVLKKGHRIT